MKFETELIRFQRQMNPHLRRALSAMFRTPSGKTLPPFMRDTVSDFVLQGGKRIRPYLFVVTYEAFGGKRSSGILDIAAALELLHAAALIHDDIIDRDTLRRGKPTLHVRLGALTHNTRRGAALALLAGDLLTAAAMRLMVEADVPLERKMSAVAYTFSQSMAMIYGEMWDIHATGAKPMGSAERARINTLKTASYTTRGPLLTGALLAGAKLSPAQRASLARCGTMIGTAFQMRDDILGLLGNEKDFGKSIGADVREGKLTVIIEHALETAPRAARTRLLAIFQKERVTLRDVRAVRSFILTYSNRDALESLLKQEYDTASRALASLPLKTGSRKKLLDLFSYLIHRTI